MYNTFTIENIGGNCPVQAEGAIDGKRFYFRARGSSWSFSVGDTDDEAVGTEGCFVRNESYGTSQFDAGWMSLEEAHVFILQAAAAYFASKKPDRAFCSG